MSEDLAPHRTWPEVWPPMGFSLLELRMRDVPHFELVEAGRKLDWAVIRELIQ